MTEVSFSLAFMGGILSFLSPCVLPLVPSYLSFITGISFEDMTADTAKARVRFLTLTNSLAFVSGFSTIFIALGASSSVIGQFFFQYQGVIRIVGGILVIIFGLFVAGFIKLGFLSYEKKLHFRGRPSGYIGAFVVGLTFAAGWTPCIGPILGSILVYAGAQASAVYGIKLLSVYSFGLALPFLMASLAINSLLSSFRIIQKHMRFVMVLSGLVLILFGILLLTNNVCRLSGIFPEFGTL